MMELKEAANHAAQGGQALHLHRIVFDSSPLCFRRAVSKGEYIAHLFDQNVVRLIATARRFGVRVLKLEKRDTGYQHIDLCGKPLQRALEVARNEGLRE